MRWTAAGLVVGVLGAVACFGQAASAPATAATTQATQPAKQRVMRMTVQPADEAVPALKYQLLPPLDDQIQGDAMTLYYTIMDRVAQLSKEHEIDTEVIQMLWETPPEEFPRDRAHAILKEYDAIMPLLDLATRQTTCNWNMQVERLGFATDLPSLSRWRRVGRIIALQAHLAIAEGRYDDAIHSLQMGYAMARHVAAAPPLIPMLVGTANATMQKEVIQRLIAGKDAPNLYWAIADLPKPLVDITRGLRMEMSVLYYTVPELREARADRLTPQQWEDLPRVLAMRLGPIFAKQEKIPDVAKGVFPSTVLPAAREYWQERGLSDKQIDTMPVNRANIVYGLAMHDRLWANVAKWSNLPYWQARAGFDRASKQAEEAAASTEAGLVFFLAGNLGNAYAHQAVLQEDLAALQTIEALRMYTARHGGKLPATLAEMTDPPAPISPVTGKPFRYEANGSTFVLDIPSPEGHPGTRSVRYEVTVRTE